MKTQLLLIVFMMTGFYGFCQKTHIPDAEFRRVLSDPVEEGYYGLTIENDSILNAEAENITNLDNLYDEGISDLTGIEAFVNITSLDCSENTLTSLDLSKNTALTQLYANDNSLTFLNLPTNNNLQLLHCSNNSLTSLNIKDSGLDRPERTLFYAENNTSLTCIESNSTSFEHRKNLGEWGFDDNVTISTSCSNTTTPLTIISNGGENMAEIVVDEEQNGVTTVETSGGVGNITFTLTTGDASLFSITNSGVLTFKEAPNFEAIPQKITYTFIVTATDRTTPNPFTDTQTINITLNDVEEVLIPDSVFEQFLLDSEYDTDGEVNGSIKLSDAKKITSLTITNSNVENLNGIESMINLEQLRCWSNPSLTSLDLSRNTALTRLECVFNPALEELDLRNGNNSNMTLAYMYGNSLACVSVDNEEATYLSDRTIWDKDLDTQYSNDCNTLINTKIAIPDANFEQALIDLGHDGNDTINGSISLIDARKITRLIVSDPDNNTTSLPNVAAKITDLTGIEAMTSLTYLDCSDNELTTLNLSSNTALTNLRVFNNQLTNLDVSGLTLLPSLDCSDNELTTLNLSSNTALTNLRASNNQLTDLDISGLTLLTSLSVRNNQLTSLNIQSTDNTLLTSLDVVGNPSICVQVNDEDYRPDTGWAFDLGTVFSENCEALINTKIAIPDANFEQALIDLGHDGNDTINGSISLIDAQSITSLDVSDPGNNTTSLPNVAAKITDLTGIEAMTSLTSLECSDNELTTLNLSSNTALTSLRASNNQLTDLDISGLTLLTSLECSDNELTTLNLSSNTALTSLRASNNQLTDLDVSGLTLLTSLLARDNGLTFLNIKNGNNHLLTYFDVIGNSSICVQVDDEEATYLSDRAIWFFDDSATFSENCSTSTVNLNSIKVDRIGAIEGKTYEKNIIHSYSEAPTGYTLTRFYDDDSDPPNRITVPAPNWITVNDGKVVVTPSYDVVESTARYKAFDFKISTVGKTPNAVGEFRVVVINNSETPIIYDGNLGELTVDEDTTGNYEILQHYSSSIDSSLELKHNYPKDADAGTVDDDHYNSNHPNWVSFPNGDIRVIPRNDEVGNHQIPFKIVDGIGNELTGTLRVTVTNINDAPTTIKILPRNNIKVLENLECWTIDSDTTETFDLSTAFSDVDVNDVLTYEIIADDNPDDGYDGVVRNIKVSNPDFVSLENSTLKCTFTPESENSRGFHYTGIKATDTSGESVTRAIMMVVGSYSPDDQYPGFRVMTACTETTDDSKSGAKFKSAKSSMSVRLGGSAISTEGEAIRERGIIYSTSANNRESLIIGGQEVSKEAMTNSEGNSFSKKIKGFTANITYYYRAYATDNNGSTSYGNIKDFVLKTDNTLSNKYVKKISFTISPNPTSSILNITAIEKADYKLMNIRGQILKKGILVSEENKIDISSFVKGIYLLSIKTSKGSFTKKVVRN